MLANSENRTFSAKIRVFPIFKHIKKSSTDLGNFAPPLHPPGCAPPSEKFCARPCWNPFTKLENLDGRTGVDRQDIGDMGHRLQPTHVH